MKNEITAAIVTNPKAGYLVAAMTNINVWWIDWGEEFLGVLTSIAGFVLVCVLIRYHWQNTKKLIKENKESKTKSEDTDPFEDG